MRTIPTVAPLGAPQGRGRKDFVPAKFEICRWHGAEAGRVANRATNFFRPPPLLVEREHHLSPLKVEGAQ